MPRFIGIEGVRSALGHGAVAATPGTDRAENHEGGGAPGEAFADIGTMGLLAHGAEMKPIEQAFHVIHRLGTRPDGGAQPLRARQQVLAANLGRAVGKDAAEFLDKTPGGGLGLHGTAQFAGHGGHVLLGVAAGIDELEPGQVRVHVKRDAVVGDPLAYGHADTGDLGPVDPDPGAAHAKLRRKAVKP